MSDETSAPRDGSAALDGIAGAEGQSSTGAQTAKPSAKRKNRTTRKKTGKARKTRPYPASSFSEALPLAEAIHKFAAGQKVRRLTLLQQMQKSPTSSATQMLITNSGKYGITTGSYAADWLELTQDGAVASAPGPLSAAKLRARFHLAIERIAPFSVLYGEYRGKRLPSRDVMKDVLLDKEIPSETVAECVDTFVVNAKDLGLIRTIAGSETLFPIEGQIEDLTRSGGNAGQKDETFREPPRRAEPRARAEGQKTDWSKLCFVITPIGDEGSETRKHADLFLSSLIEPALKEFGLRVVRADKIGAPGMITSQVLEHVMRARLAIVDLSFHNPNAFYEMALRHACALPVVQISRRCDAPPFDVNQMRTAMIDTSDIYTLVPKLETYRSEIATQVRAALADGTTGNPITAFFPEFKVTIPAEK